MMASLVDFAGVFLVVLVGCQLLERAVPLRREPFAVHMRVRTLHLMGRIAVVLLTVAVALSLFRRDAVAVTVGAIGGWLVSAGVETWRMGRTGRSGREAE